MAVFVGDESIRYRGGLSASLAEGARLVILPAVSGG
jgi:molybdopterin converting factor small subunit